jgi:hypothetical protein
MAAPVGGLSGRGRMYVKEFAIVAKLVQDDRKLVLPRNDDPGIGRSGLKELNADRA